MNLEISLDCPQCLQVIDCEIPAGELGELQCPRCCKPTGFHLGGCITPEGMVERCVRCHCSDFFWQSDFNRRIGFGLLLFTIALSVGLFSRGWGFWAMLPMAFGALFDLVLYWLLPKVTVCYRCRAQYRGGVPNPNHGPHDLHKLEEYEHEARLKAKAEGKDFDPRIPQALYADHVPGKEPPQTEEAPPSE